MRKPKFTASQIALVLKQVEEGNGCCGGLPQVRIGFRSAENHGRKENCQQLSRPANRMRVYCSCHSDFVESFNGRLRDEFLNETLFRSLDHARAAIEEWRRDYNTVRPHSRIGWLTPAVHAAQFGPQWATPLRTDGSAAWPIATAVKMEKINPQAQLATG